MNGHNDLLRAARRPSKLDDALAFAALIVLGVSLGTLLFIGLGG